MENNTLKFGLERVTNTYCFIKTSEAGIEYTFLVDGISDGFKPINSGEEISMIEDHFVPKKLILMGAGASGKDYYRDKIVEAGLRKEISYTTREPRPNEVSGDSYHYIDKSKFEAMIMKKEFLQWNKFGNDKYYGTLAADFDKYDVFIMTPSALKMMTPEQRKQSYIIYFKISEEIRRERLISRSDDNDDVERRLGTDRVDFEGFDDYDKVVIDEKFTV